MRYLPALPYRVALLLAILTALIAFDAHAGTINAGAPVAADFDPAVLQ